MYVNIRKFTIYNIWSWDLDLCSMLLTIHWFLSDYTCKWPPKSPNYIR